jgi:hypothetical protein
METELTIHAQNYKRIMIALENYPEWKLKVHEDFNKLLGFSNMKETFPEFYEILVY